MHVPEARRRIPVLAKAAYRRSYFRETLEPDADRAPIDFDLITEITFASQADFESFATALGDPKNAQWIADDGLNYTDPGKTRSYLVEEHTSK